jgi:hypothetical protein
MPLNLLDRLRKSNILKSKFLKSVSILASGSVIAMAINAATAPFITRLFEPAGMGVFTYLLAICHLFMSSVNGRYDMSIVTEEKEERVYPLIKLSFLIGVIVSAVVSVGFGIYFKFFSEVYASSSYLAVFIFISNGQPELRRDCLRLVENGSAGVNCSVCRGAVLGNEPAGEGVKATFESSA